MMDVDSPLLLPIHKEIIGKLKDIGAIKQCSFGDKLQEEQKYRMITCRFIKRAHWSITGKCNLRGRHCYMLALQAKYGELSQEQCLNIVQLQETMPIVTEIPLRQALSDSSYLKLIDTWLCDLLSVNETCNVCEHKLYCGGGCRAGVLVSNGEYLACDDYTCYFFKNNFEEK